MKPVTLSTNKPSSFHSQLSQPTKFKPTNQSTIAELNCVSMKDHKITMSTSTPFRIHLPEYFNIPAFKDIPLHLSTLHPQVPQAVAIEDIILKKRMKDLALLSEGMKRSKNIKQQSRYYYIQGVLLHNSQQYKKSIEQFEKFLKIVIFLNDEKSVELALNIIGCAHMYLGNMEKSVEFHEKQAEISRRADRFISYCNIGMCYQMLGKNEDAYSCYQKIKSELFCEDDNNKSSSNNQQRQRQQQQQESTTRRQVLSQLIQRSEKKILESQIFMTQKYGQKKSKSPIKSIKSSFIKEESSLIMKKMANRKQYEEAKLKYAISAAQENIDQYLKKAIEGREGVEASKASK